MHRNAPQNSLTFPTHLRTGPVRFLGRQVLMPRRAACLFLLYAHGIWRPTFGVAMLFEASQCPEELPIFSYFRQYAEIGIKAKIAKS
jgi:hypothetical protein